MRTFSEHKLPKLSGNKMKNEINFEQNKVKMQQSRCKWAARPLIDAELCLLIGPRCKVTLLQRCVHGYWS